MRGLLIQIKSGLKEKKTTAVLYVVHVNIFRKF